MFDVVDHNDVDRTLRRFQFKAELLLDRGEKTRNVRVVRRVAAGRLAALLGREGQIEIPGAGQSGSIGDEASREDRKRGRNLGSGKTAELDGAWTNAAAAEGRLRSCRSSAARHRCGGGRAILSR